MNLDSIPLQHGIVYGPVRSRRLGRSLGLNVLPSKYKVCSFDCVYCQYGWTEAWCLNGNSNHYDFTLIEDFANSLEAALHKPMDIDNITFSGNGESTLHPQFDHLVDVAVDLKHKLKPAARLGILSNSTTAGNDKIRTALNKLDFRIMKLDAGGTDTFMKINKPCKAVDLEAIVEGLRKLDVVTIQSMFIEGVVQNTGNREISDWINRIKYIKPIKIQIYSIDRPPAEKLLLEVSKEKLMGIAEKTMQETGIPVEVFVR